VIELLAAAALTPTPIGPGRAYAPSAGRPLERCADRRAAAHVELFANRRAIVIPAGIGGCNAGARTRAPAGIVELARPGLVLGDLFRAWGRPLGAHRLLSFRSSATVRVYVNGRAVSGAVTAVPLTPGAEVVVELGGYVPPHRAFLFPRRTT